MNCDKCRWNKASYCTYVAGTWTIKAMCLLGGCDGSQYEPDFGVEDLTEAIRKKMIMPKATEKERFLQILAQAEYELLDGVNIPGVKRTFGQVERDTIKGVCAYIEKMVDYCDRRGMLVREEYEAEVQG